MWCVTEARIERLNQDFTSMYPYYNRQLCVWSGTMWSRDSQAQAVLADISNPAREWKYITSSLRAPSTGLRSINNGPLWMLQGNGRCEAVPSSGIFRVEDVLKVLYAIETAADIPNVSRGINNHRRRDGCEGDSNVKSRTQVNGGKRKQQCS